MQWDVRGVAIRHIYKCRVWSGNMVKTWVNTLAEHLCFEYLTF